MHTDKKKQSEMVITFLHLKVTQGWDAVDKIDEFFKQIKTKARNCLKVFRHTGGLDAMDLNSPSNNININQVIKRGTASMKKRR